jgi:Kef-type K+ transport system membrane component KefB
VSHIQLGVLFILGIGAFGGMLGASLFQRIRIPQVVGYIAIGLILGQSGFHIVQASDISSLAPFNLFALGLIGFLVGGELQADNFRKYKKQLFAILMGEGMAAFLLVGVSTGLVVWLAADSLHAALAAGIVFGAIASATDPVSTINVLWEYRARGALTSTLIMIVALDDALAMTLYGLGTSVAGMLTGGASSIGRAGLKVGIELAGAVVMGFLMGLLLDLILRRTRQKEKTLVVSVGSILLTIGIAAAVRMDVILATMTLGVTLCNMAPRRSKELFSLIKSLSNPIYVIFFVLVGARLNVLQMPPWVWGIVIVYVLGSSLGKMSGTWWGARHTGAPPEIRKYGGLGLFAQGGVAVGLSIMASQHLGYIPVTDQLSLGDTIVFGVTATTLILQIVGPPMVKLAIKLSGEIGRNVTEEDIISLWTVKDAMDKETFHIREHDPLSRIFEIISMHDATSYPVVDRDDKIVGIITLEGLQNLLANQESWDWLVVADVMIPAAEKIHAATPLKDAIALMEQLRFDLIPVVRSESDDRVAGILDMRKLKRLVREEVYRRQKQRSGANA